MSAPAVLALVAVLSRSLAVVLMAVLALQRREYLATQFVPMPQCLLPLRGPQAAFAPQGLEVSSVTCGQLCRPGRSQQQRQAPGQ